MHIFFTLDNEYISYFAVCLASILTNASDTDVFNFYVIGNDISEENRSHIETLKSIKNFEIEYISFNSHMIHDFPAHMSPHISSTALYRLFLSSLKPNLDRAICLDADLVVLKSLESLWNMDIDNYHVAASIDYTFTKNEILWVNQLKKTLCLEKNYFNSGVLLCNLKKWRADAVEEKFISAMVNYKQDLCFPEQDILNHVFKDSYLLISDEWNLNANDHGALPSDINILHWAGPMKPWKPWHIWNPSGESFRNEYFWRYAKLTPYYETIILEFTKNNVVALATVYQENQKNMHLLFNAALSRRITFLKHKFYTLLAFISHSKNHITKRKNYANQLKSINSILYR